jgi:outer membrane immunogenic protein
MVLAADLEPISPAEVFDWSSFYVGAHAGYGSIDNRITDVDGFSNNDPGTDFDYDDEDFVGGALLGFNVPIDNILLGAEADIAFGDLSASTDVDVEDFDETATTDYDYLASIRARVGFVADAFLIYATGGLAIADIENELIDEDDGEVDPDDSFHDDETRLGWVAGGGAEWMFAENWIGRAEALYYDFGEECYHVDVTDENAQYDVENTAFIARIAIIWKM